MIELLGDHQTGGLDDPSRRADIETEYWQEQGPWLVLLLLPVVAFGFRRGLLTGLIVVLTTLPPPVVAWAWEDLWWRRDQQVQRVLDAQQFVAAMRLASDPGQLGTAAYRAGRFADAVTAFSQLDDATSHYNRGNALLQLGRFREAIDAYDSALARDPQLQDAKFNRALGERLLREQQEEQSQPQQPQGGADTAEQHQREEQQKDKAGNNSADSASEASGQGQEKSGSSEGRDQDTESAGSASDNAEQAQSRPGQPSDQPPDRERLQPNDEQTRLNDERQQVLEQWLRRIPDDPGGLLRRKFLYQYQRRSVDQPQQAW